MLIYTSSESINSGNKLDGTAMTNEELQECINATTVGQMMNTIGFGLALSALALGSFVEQINYNDIHNSSVDFYVGTGEGEVFTSLEEADQYYTSKYGENWQEVLQSSGGTTIPTENVRVGRWMSQGEYDKMVATGKVQMSPNGNTTYVAYPADPNAFGSQATPGSIYVEFDVPKSSLYTAGDTSWQQIAGPGSFWDRLNQSKGLPAITEMPNVWNIKIVGGK